MKRRGKKKGNIVLFWPGYLDSGPQIKDIEDYVKEVLEKPKNDGFILYISVSDTDAEEPAQEAIATMYSSYLQDVDGIICSGYINSQVLAKTMNEKKSNHDIVAICEYNAPEVLEAIHNGYIFGTMANNSWAIGYVGTTALKLFADGYTWKEDAPYFIDSGSYLLTKYGLETHEKNQYQTADDFVAMMKEKYLDPPDSQ